MNLDLWRNIFFVLIRCPKIGKRSNKFYSIQMFQFIESGRKTEATIDRHGERERESDAKRCSSNLAIYNTLMVQSGRMSKAGEQKVKPNACISFHLLQK